MGDVVQVTPEALHKHAGEVTAFMNELRGATTEASSTWDVKTFGIANIFLAQILQAWTNSAKNLIDATIEAGTLIAEQTDAMADAYTTSDQESHKDFKVIDGNLDGSGK